MFLTQKAGTYSILLVHIFSDARASVKDHGAQNCQQHGTLRHVVHANPLLAADKQPRQEDEGIATYNIHVK